MHIINKSDRGKGVPMLRNLVGCLSVQSSWPVVQIAAQSGCMRAPLPIGQLHVTIPALTKTILSVALYRVSRISAKIHMQLMTLDAYIRTLRTNLFTYPHTQNYL